MIKKILLAAFSCAPNLGSDAEVGWKWATTLKNHDYDVWIITRKIYRLSIEKEICLTKYQTNLHFIYFDIDIFLRFASKIPILHNYFYYYLWQWGAYKKAVEIHEKVHFDIVHHISWVSVRQPSFMGNIGIPFIFGPVAGGECAPWSLRFGYSFRQWRMDILRDFMNFYVRIDPLMWLTFQKATIIYVTSNDTLRLIPRRFRSKTKVQLAIGNNWHLKKLEKKDNIDFYPEDSIHILYVGRFIGWKGMHLGFHAFKKVVKRDHSVKLTMVGRGSDEHHWRKLANSLSIDHHINWISWVERHELPKLYKRHDLFLFPSLHDSGGLVVLEAMGHGLPVICLGLGGPGVMVDDSCGKVIDVTGKSRKRVVNELADNLLFLIKNDNLRGILSKNAVERAQLFKWENLIKAIYNPGR